MNYELLEESYFTASSLRHTVLEREELRSNQSHNPLYEGRLKSFHITHFTSDENFPEGRIYRDLVTSITLRLNYICKYIQHYVVTGTCIIAEMIIL